MMHIVLQAIIDQDEEDVEKGEEIPLRWIDMEDEEEEDSEEERLNRDFLQRGDALFGLPQSERPGPVDWRECAFCKCSYIVGSVGHACGLCYDCIAIKRASKTLVWEGHDVVWEEHVVKVNVTVDSNLMIKRDQFS